ncbi:MAG: fimbrial assembly protein [Burkholderiales bacterium]
MTTPRFCSGRQQSGSMLIEVLVAVLIFSIGILGIVGLYGASVRNAGDAKYRVDASLLASEFVAQIWIANRSTATWQDPFNAGGARFLVWKAAVEASLPGNIAPTAVVTNAGMVTIQINWRAPSEPADTSHQYVAVSQVQ